MLATLVKESKRTWNNALNKAYEVLERLYGNSTFDIVNQK